MNATTDDGMVARRRRKEGTIKKRIRDSDLSRLWSEMIGGEGAFALWVSVPMSMCSVQRAACARGDGALDSLDSLDRHLNLDPKQRKYTQTRT